MSRKGVAKTIFDICLSASSAATHYSTCAAATRQVVVPRACAKARAKRHAHDNVAPWRNAVACSLRGRFGVPHCSHTLGAISPFSSAAAPQESTGKSCWFCGDCTRTGQPFSCDNCGYLQPPSKDTDYYALFGMKRAFDIDQKLLERRFRDMQMAVHPDKHATKGEDIKLISQQQSSHLNTAFNVLKCPLARAKYLLELEGLHISEESRIDDTAFLMEVMEIREEASAAQDRDELLVLAEQNLQRRTKYAERIRDAYAESEFQLMIKLVQELTYFHRIEQLLRDKL